MKLSTVLFWMTGFFFLGSLMEHGIGLTGIALATGILAFYVSETED